MKLTRERLVSAAEESGIAPEQASRLWEVLSQRTERAQEARFDATQVAYYFGALLVIGAMGWFINRAWDTLGGWGLAAIALCYAASFAIAGNLLWKGPARVAGGLLIAVAVCMMPLATFGIEKALGLWPAEGPRAYSEFHPWIDKNWILMEAVTVLAGVVALRFWKFPFLTAPIAYALWYLSMDLPEFLLRRDRFWDQETKELISLYFGLAMLAVTYFADLRRRDKDFTFWGYLFGTAAFWGGLSMMDSDSEWSKAAYCAINLLLMVFSLVLQRRALMVFGALGVFGYLSHLAYSVFKDSLLFPGCLVLIGLAVIALGILYQKKRRGVGIWVRESVMPVLGGLVPPRARAELEGY